MTDRDFDAFVREFQRLSGALERRPQSLEQIRVRADAYFHALRSLPLEVVIAKADTWLARETKFPVPAQWLHAAVQRRPHEQITLSESQIGAYRAAREMSFQGEPCRCADCQRAGVTHRFLRFVPDVDESGNVPAMPLGGPEGVVVYAGHWAHGEELRRWYTARDRFYALKGTLKGPLAAVFGSVVRATEDKRAPKVRPMAAKESAWARSKIGYCCRFEPPVSLSRCANFGSRRHGAGGRTSRGRNIGFCWNARAERSCMAGIRARSECGMTRRSTTRRFYLAFGCCA